MSLQANNVNVVCMANHKVCFIYLQGILMTNATTTSNEPPKYNKQSLSGCCTLWKMMHWKQFTSRREQIYFSFIFSKRFKTIVFHWIRCRLLVFRNSIQEWFEDESTQQSNELPCFIQFRASPLQNNQNVLKLSDVVKLADTCSTTTKSSF